jgi:soluble lytic murein transglycosylase-like protein
VSAIAAIDARIAELQGLQARLQQVVAPGRALIDLGTPATAEAGTSFAAALQAAGTTATPAPGDGTSGDAGPYGPMIAEAAQRHGLDERILTELVRQESGFDPNATSPAGARGLTQLMPGTAASLGVTDPTDPAQAIDGGARYLRQQLDAFGGDYAKALAAYNAGPGAVQRYGGVPPYGETQHYVSTILGKAGR